MNGAVQLPRFARFNAWLGHFSSRRAHVDTAAVGLLLLLALVLWLPRLNGPIDLRYDAGVYYILGTSLAEGTGYRLLNEPGAIQAVQYPPLLPLFVAGHQLALGTTDPTVVAPWLRISFFLLFLGYAAASYLLARRFLAPGIALLAAALAVMQPEVIWLSDLLFTELPYTLATLLFFLAVAGIRSPTLGRECAAGILAIAAYLLRSVGIALLAAWVGEAVLRRRWRRAALRVVVALLPVLGWQAYLASVTDGPEYANPSYSYQRAPYQFYNVTYAENMQYIDPFAPELGQVSGEQLLARVARNFTTSVSALGQAVSVKPTPLELFIEEVNASRPGLDLPGWLARPPFLVLGCFVVAGLLLLTLRGEKLIPLYVLGSVLLISTTPWAGQFTRYLVPLAPLLTLALFFGLVEAWKGLGAVKAERPRRGGRLLVVLVAAGAFTLQGRLLHWLYFEKHVEVTYEDAAGREHQHRFFNFDRGWQQHTTALGWLADVAEPDEVIITWTSHYAYLLTGHPAVMPPFEADPAQAQRLVEDFAAPYLILDQGLASNVSERYAAPMIEMFPERWELIYSSSDSTALVYRLAREPSDGHLSAPRDDREKGLEEPPTSGGDTASSERVGSIRAHLDEDPSLVLTDGPR